MSIVSGYPETLLSYFGLIIVTTRGCLSEGKYALTFGQNNLVLTTAAIEPSDPVFNEAIKILASRGPRQNLVWTVKGGKTYFWQLDKPVNLAIKQGMF